ncbi:PAS domain-containing protein [Polyangium sp. 15x6]|uniref:PAS domain-containing protein n=1 Tax=Polyangium sp. 15x6 TaxID=3042687 RepID=UPI00249C728F|nr:PAS domain-containing protein [Polyangium sp. 15x6]MDI3281945.1 PAS domain-containing protein [Polyangium sp. 15x6]
MEEQALSAEALRSEVAALRARLQEAEMRGSMLRDLIDCVPGAVWESWFVEDPSRGRVGYVSRQIRDITGYTQEEWLAQPGLWSDLAHPEDKDYVLAGNQHLERNGRSVLRFRWVRRDGSVLWIEAQTVCVREGDGRTVGLRGIIMDVTAAVRADQERAEALLQQEALRAKEATLLELSTPLIPVSDAVMVMPLVGDIDPARAQRAITVLLEGMARSGASVAILDITGVPQVDAEVADALVRAARSVAMLGAEPMLTGIRPEVAQTLVSMGIDLSGIGTHSTLQTGIARAMRRARMG